PPPGQFLAADPLPFPRSAGGSGLGRPARVTGRRRHAPPGTNVVAYRPQARSPEDALPLAEHDHALERVLRVRLDPPERHGSERRRLLPGLAPPGVRALLRHPRRARRPADEDAERVRVADRLAGRRHLLRRRARPPRLQVVALAAADRGADR